MLGKSDESCGRVARVDEAETPVVVKRSVPARYAVTGQVEMRCTSPGPSRKPELATTTSAPASAAASATCSPLAFCRGVREAQSSVREGLPLVGGAVGREGRSNCRHARDVDDSRRRTRMPASRFACPADVDRAQFVQPRALVRDDACQMEDALTAVGGPPQSGQVGQVAAHDADTLRFQIRCVGAFADERANVGAALAQCCHQVPAEEARCPGDERRHGVKSSGRA